MKQYFFNFVFSLLISGILNTICDSCLWKYVLILTSTFTDLINNIVQDEGSRLMPADGVKTKENSTELCNSNELWTFCGFFNLGTPKLAYLKLRTPIVFHRNKLFGSYIYVFFFYLVKKDYSSEQSRFFLYTDQIKLHLDKRDMIFFKSS